MTLELRARRAADGIHVAVAQVQPRSLPSHGRSRRRRGRGTIALVLALLAPPTGAALFNPARQAPEPGQRRILDDTRRGEVPVPDGRGAALVQDGTGAVGIESGPGGGREFRGGGAVPSPSPASRTSDYDFPAPGICEPLITDAKGDLRTYPPTQGQTVENPAIDILESWITYDSAAHVLVIRHVIDDIPPNPPLPNEALVYEFHFTLGATWYMVQSYIHPTSQGWHYSVQRDDRTRADDWPNVPRRSVVRTTGSVDTEQDTVTIVIGIAEFNAGERETAAEEGLPPAAELVRGSRLTKIKMAAYPRSAGPGAYDEAYGCDYIVPSS